MSKGALDKILGHRLVTSVTPQRRVTRSLLDLNSELDKPKDDRQDELNSWINGRRNLDNGQNFNIL